jgi:unsaturated rhamnogalacturonyl hydrolase
VTRFLRFNPAIKRLHVLLFVLCILIANVGCALPRSTGPTSQPARVFARYVPEAFDDIAWENDRIAFRVYGPALETQQPTGSGIDVWVKSTRKLVLNRWYAADNYDKDHGEGLDFYSVGQSRGCGGIGIWNGSSLDVSRIWQKHRILQNGPDRAVIELTYAPWKTGSRTVWETRRITLNAGSNLNRIESTIASDHSDPLVVAIGIARRAGDGGQAILDRNNGMICYWQPADPVNGSIATAVLVDPGQLQKLLTTPNHYLALLTVTPGKPFVYYAGAGWSKSGDFPSPESWEMYLRKFPVRFTVQPATRP